MFSQGFGNLTPARIMNTNKGYFLFLRHFLFFMKWAITFQALIILVKRVQKNSFVSIEIPKCSSGKLDRFYDCQIKIRSTERGPFSSPIFSSAFPVIWLHRPQFFVSRGVDFVTMDRYIPVLIPAPQAPQNPQAPPGTSFPLRSISINAFSSSSSPPAL